MVAVRHLGFVRCILDPLTKSIWSFLSFAKFGWNPCSRKFLIFQAFGLKMPIHTAKIPELWGI